MPSHNVPCINPTLCGVQSHLPGTIAECRKGRTAQAGSTAQKLAALAPTPAINRNYSESETHQISGILSKRPEMQKMARILLDNPTEQETGAAWGLLSNTLDNDFGEATHADAIEVERLLVREVKYNDRDEAEALEGDEPRPIHPGHTVAFKDDKGVLRGGRAGDDIGQGGKSTVTLHDKFGGGDVQVDSAGILPAGPEDKGEGIEELRAGMLDHEKQLNPYSWQR